jgi:DNA-binding SARP family transcriptional activator/tetratricopeptide (TPR) repeat protein
MWFGLLGPLEVNDGGRTLVLHGGKQRALLAALLLKAGQLQPCAELAELVWDGAPPPRSAVTLRSYVMRLRQALGPVAGSRIVTADSGYLAEVAEDEFDVTCFTGLCATGAAAARSGAWQQARDALTEAQRLWRGSPLADIPCQMLQAAEVPRLEQLNMQASQSRIEASLQLGHCHELVPELRRLTLQHPLQEPFHAQLMLALYLAGRQAEALEVYRDARRVLVSQLGVEPGPELQQMHQRILAHDRALSVAPRLPEAAAPHQLPPLVRHFAGRDAELGTLTRLLGTGPVARTLVISAISGTAGVGKTALAVQLGHQVAGQYPDGQLYLNLRGYDPGQPMDPGEALAGLMHALGAGGREIPADAEERAAHYRSLLASRRVLILLDNARSPEQVRPLLPGTPGCAVVVTSRDGLAGLVARDGARRLELGLLPADDAIALLRMLIGKRADVEPEATQALAAQCARLPLALRIAAELVARRPASPLSELAGELADQRRRLDLLDAGGDSCTAVRSVFWWSYRHLDAPAGRAFRLLGLHPGADFDLYDAAALAGVTPQQAGDLLDLLARAHLVQATVPGRFSMHDLLRAYAAELAIRHDTETGRRAALTRLFDHYLQTAAEAMDTLFPAERPRRPAVPPAASAGPRVTEPVAAQAWLDAQRENLVAVADHMASGWPGYADRLAAVVFRYLDDGGHHREAAAIYRHARRGARQTNDAAGESAALTGLGAACWRLGRYGDAANHLEQALGLCRQTGDLVGQARAVGILGLVVFQQGRYEQAARYYQQALGLYRQIHNRDGEASSLGNLGDVDLRLGRYERAASHHRQALELSRQTGNRTCEAYALTNIGLVELRRDRRAHAVGPLQQALDLSRQTGNRSCQAYALASLGEVELREGRCQLATARLRESLALFRETGDRAGEAEALNGLGDVFLAMGHCSPALAEYTAALNVACQIGNMYEKARANNGLACAHRANGDAANARLHWQQALCLYTDLAAPEADQVRDQLASI